MRGKAFGTVASPVQRLGAPGAAVAFLRRVVAAQVGGTVSGTQTLTAPVKGTYRLAILGPGGQGAQSVQSNAALGGGGSGGLAVSKPFQMAAGQTLSVSCGAAAAAQTLSGKINGAAGLGATTATTPDGAALSAGPGQGGSNAGAAGNGGDASGGEFNYPGLAGGSATAAGGSAQTGNPSASETFLIDGVSVTPIRYIPVGIVNSGSNIGAGGGGNPPLGGFVPLSSGTDATSAPGGLKNSATAIGAATGGWWYAGGGGTGPTAAHGGAYLILEF